MNRNRLLGMIHMAAKKTGWDDDTYRGWLEKHTGKRSCKDCTDKELSLAADLMRDLGMIDSPHQKPTLGGTGRDRPTEDQWRAVIAISKKCGLSGALTDPALATFCKRVTKVDNPRFLDRHAMSDLINGLDNWAKSKSKRKAAACS